MLYGHVRTTDDLDVVIYPDEQRVRQLVRGLAADYYVDEDDAAEAVRRGTSFSAIHLQTMVRVDFFVAERTREVRVQFERRRVRLIREREVAFYAPEDVLIRKLIWFRLGGEVSDRQWNDVLGILRLAREPLDYDYLARAAADFNVSDLLQRAQEDAASR